MRGVTPSYEVRGVTPTDAIWRNQLIEGMHTDKKQPHCFLFSPLSLMIHICPLSIVTSVFAPQVIQSDLLLIKQIDVLRKGIG